MKCYSSNMYILKKYIFLNIFLYITHPLLSDRLKYDYMQKVKVKLYIPQRIYKIIGFLKIPTRTEKR